MSKQKGTLTLSNPTGDVSFTIEATLLKLEAPEITVSGTTVSWGAVTHAQYYTIYIDGTAYPADFAVTSKDISTLSVWSSLADGNHSVYVIAKATGYTSSDPSNTVTVVKGNTMPEKGDIITIESNRYRVLAVSGTQAKLFGLFDATTTAFGSNNTYAGSTLDTALNTTWLGRQSTTFQDAVVDSSITTSTYSYNSTEPSTWAYEFDYNWDTSKPRYAARTATTSAITRKVYAMDLSDYYDYKGTNTTTSNDLMKFFFEGDGTSGSYSGKYCWLRSADADGSSYAWRVFGVNGHFTYNGVSYSCAVRPALNIDLSKISWTSE